MPPPDQREYPEIGVQQDYPNQYNAQNNAANHQLNNYPNAVPRNPAQQGFNQYQQWGNQGGYGNAPFYEDGDAFGEIFTGEPNGFDLYPRKNPYVTQNFRNPYQNNMNRANFVPNYGQNIPNMPYRGIGNVPGNYRTQGYGQNKQNPDSYKQSLINKYKPPSLQITNTYKGQSMPKNVQKKRRRVKKGSLRTNFNPMNRNTNINKSKTIITNNYLMGTDNKGLRKNYKETEEKITSEELKKKLEYIEDILAPPESANPVNYVRNDTNQTRITVEELKRELINAHIPKSVYMPSDNTNETDKPTTTYNQTQTTTYNQTQTTTKNNNQNENDKRNSNVAAQVLDDEYDYEDHSQAPNIKRANNKPYQRFYNPHEKYKPQYQSNAGYQPNANPYQYTNQNNNMKMVNSRNMQALNNINSYNRKPYNTLYGYDWKQKPRLNNANQYNNYARDREQKPQIPADPIILQNQQIPAGNPNVQDQNNPESPDYNQNPYIAQENHNLNTIPKEEYSPGQNQQPDNQNLIPDNFNNVPGLENPHYNEDNQNQNQIPNNQDEHFLQPNNKHPNDQAQNQDQGENNQNFNIESEIFNTNISHLINPGQNQNIEIPTESHNNHSPNQSHPPGQAPHDIPQPQNPETQTENPLPHPPIPENQDIQPKENQNLTIEHQTQPQEQIPKGTGNQTEQEMLKPVPFPYQERPNVTMSSTKSQPIVADHNPGNVKPDIKGRDPDYFDIPGWNDLGVPTLKIATGSVAEEIKVVTVPVHTEMDFVITTPEPDSVVVQAAKKAMLDHKLGYFLGFVHELFQIIADKNHDEARDLIASTRLVLDDMVDSGALVDMGEPAYKGLRNVADLATSWSADSVQANLKVGQFRIINRQMLYSPEVVLVLNIIDSAYNIPQGESLLKTLNSVDKYPDGNTTAMEVAKEVVDGVLLAYWTAPRPNRAKLFQMITDLMVRYNTMPQMTRRKTSDGKDKHEKKKKENETSITFKIEKSKITSEKTKDANGNRKSIIGKANEKKTLNADKRIKKLRTQPAKVEGYDRLKQDFYIYEKNMRNKHELNKIENKLLKTQKLDETNLNNIKIHHISKNQTTRKAVTKNEYDQYIEEIYKIYGDSTEEIYKHNDDYDDSFDAGIKKKPINPEETRDFIEKSFAEHTRQSKTVLGHLKKHSKQNNENIQQSKHRKRFNEYTRDNKNKKDFTTHTKKYYTNKMKTENFFNQESRKNYDEEHIKNKLKNIIKNSDFSLKKFRRLLDGNKSNDGINFIRKFDELSSGSDEEMRIKSNIYKVFGFGSDFRKIV